MKIIYNSSSPDIVIGNTYKVIVVGCGMLLGGTVKIVRVGKEFITYKYTDSESLDQCPRQVVRDGWKVRRALGIDV